ncbi:unnamed protein product [Leptosia nina]|uniref:AB hydrolase-1 domain-containing protein n=1 Tax=Leptosia nina TaxID=320188 RepID=A0AAV1K6M8_9NEOP
MVLLEKEWFIEAPWGRICIVAWGNCYDPPLLACHGSIDSAACFRPLIKLLPHKFYYIGVELPGNGKSDPFPPGVVLSIYDYVYAIQVVVRHFRWERFVFMAHSFGAAVANIFNLCYPGKISKLIQFDPVAGKIVVPRDFSTWYEKSYGEYFNNIDFFNAPVENTKKVLREEALQNMMKRRSLPLECAEATLERTSVSAGNGFVRYTHDRRMKIPQMPPFSMEQYKDMMKNVKTPTLTIVAQGSIDHGYYKLSSLEMDEEKYPNRNCRVRFVEGYHDVHFSNPERVVPFVAEFLMNGDSKAKL